MSVKGIISNIGNLFLGLVIMLALLALPAIFVAGGVIVAEKLLPWLMLLSAVFLGINIFLLLPLAMVSETRQWAALGFVISSYVFGITGWFFGLLLTWMLWGSVAVVMGLFIFGVGVVPMGMLAAMFNGMGAEFGILVLAVLLAFGLRILGMKFLINSKEECLVEE